MASIKVCTLAQFPLYCTLLHCATVQALGSRDVEKRNDMPDPDYTLDLDRSRPQTIREQARQAIVEAIRAGRPGFCAGERLTTLALAGHNPIHRNTLTAVMDDLVRLGFLRRLPNRGFEVVRPAAERPAQLTRQILSLSEVAERNGYDSRSELIAGECGLRTAGELTGPLARVRDDLVLAAGDAVDVLARCRLMKARGAHRWDLVAIEQSFIPTCRVVGFVEAARQQIESEGDFSVYRQLRRSLPNEEFFKAHYEISLAPLPAALAAHWAPPAPLMCVVAITYCSQGPVELTRTWFDTSRAVLLAGSLEVRLQAGSGAENAGGGRRRAAG
jgi:DNA-binding GntR family transcriptional regulator